MATTLPDRGRGGPAAHRPSGAGTPFGLRARTSSRTGATAGRCSAATHRIPNGAPSASGPTGAATQPRPSHRSAATRPSGSPPLSRRSSPSVAITRTRSWPRHGYETRGAGAPAAFVAAGELIAAERPERGNLRSDGRRSGNGHQPRSCTAVLTSLRQARLGGCPAPGRPRMPPEDHESVVRA
jgi:hypothetical protein